MTADHHDDDRNAEVGNVVSFRAAEVQAAGVQGGAQPPVYADITAPGARKPVLRHWLHGRDAFASTAKVRAGYGWYLARFHGLRLPWYALVTLFWAVAGTVRLAIRWVRWWLFPVPLEVYADAIADGHRHWHRTHAVPTLALMPFGSESLSGRWVARISTTPIAGPTLMMNSASSAACLPCFGWANRFCASSIVHTIGHSRRLRRLAISRVTRFWGHRSRGSALTRGKRRTTSARSIASDCAA
jgi:hypothetical protein